MRLQIGFKVVLSVVAAVLLTVGSAQASNYTDVDILNFALNLEVRDNCTAQLSAFSGVRARKSFYLIRPTCLRAAFFVTATCTAARASAYVCYSVSRPSFTHGEHMARAFTQSPAL